MARAKTGKPQSTQWGVIRAPFIAYPQNVRRVTPLDALKAQADGAHIACNACSREIDLTKGHRC